MAGDDGTRRGASNCRSTSEETLLGLVSVEVAEGIIVSTDTHY